MSIKESQKKIAANMHDWQKIEKAGIASTGKIMERCENPLVYLIMEIIQRDSQMHFRVQEFIKDSLEKKAISLQPEELAKVWEMIEEHIKLEQSTIELAKSTLGETKKAKGMLLQHYLIEYLLKDEEKHDAILENLRKIKAGMHPYA